MQDSGQSGEPRLMVEDMAGAKLVLLTDRKILDEINITQIGQELARLVAESDTPKIIVDFGNVAHMSSSALGMLITLHKRVAEKKGQLRFCNIQPSIHEVFVITRLNEIFRIHQSRAEAVESLQ